MAETRREVESTDFEAAKFKSNCLDLEKIHSNYAIMDGDNLWIGIKGLSAADANFDQHYFSPKNIDSWFAYHSDQWAETEDGARHIVTFFQPLLASNVPGKYPEFTGHQFDQKYKVTMKELLAFRDKVDGADSLTIGLKKVQLWKFPFQYYCPRRGCMYHPTHPETRPILRSDNFLSHYQSSCRGILVEQDLDWPVILRLPTHRGPNHKCGSFRRNPILFSDGTVLCNGTCKDNPLIVDFRDIVSQKPPNSHYAKLGAIEYTGFKPFDLDDKYCPTGQSQILLQTIRNQVVAFMPKGWTKMTEQNLSYVKKVNMDI